MNEMKTLTYAQALAVVEGYLAKERAEYANQLAGYDDRVKQWEADVRAEAEEAIAAYHEDKGRYVERRVSLHGPPRWDDGGVRKAEAVHFAMLCMNKTSFTPEEQRLLNRAFSCWIFAEPKG